MENIKKMILDYLPCNQEECMVKESFMQFVNSFDAQSLNRSNLVGHMTVSCWISNQDFTKILMVHHNLYHMWSWVGGHVDGEQDLLKVALKETEEETGLSKMRLLSPGPIDFNILVVHDHFKRGQFVPRHLHYNVVYAFEADETLPLRIKPDENSAVEWIDIEKIADLCAGDNALPYYQRIMQKIKKIG